MRIAFLSVLLLLLGQLLPAQLVNGSFIHSGYVRTFDTYLPSGWSPSRQMPLVLDFHYLGADGRDEDSLTQFRPIADTAGFVVCYPYGLGTDWLVGQVSPYASGLIDVTFIDRVIDSLHAYYNIDLQRVYVTGMGQGGFMGQLLACELGDRIAAVATVGASIADSAAYYCHVARPMPMMIVHGTADSVVPYYTGLPGVWRPIPDLLSFWRQRNGCLGIEVAQGLPDLVNEGSTITTHYWQCGVGNEVLHYEVVNGGFAWPGATRDLGSGGIRNMDINASAHIWDFFKRFDINGLVGVSSSVSLSPAFEIFPNPSVDVLHVRVATGSLGQVTLRDLHGRVMPVPSVREHAQALKVDVSALPSGIYLLEAAGTQRRVSVMR